MRLLAVIAFLHLPMSAVGQDDSDENDIKAAEELRDLNINRQLKRIRSFNRGCVQDKWYCNQECRVKFPPSTGHCQPAEKGDECFGQNITYSYTRDHNTPFPSHLRTLQQFPDCWASLAPLICAWHYRPCIPNVVAFEKGLNESRIEMWQVFPATFCSEAREHCQDVIALGAWPNHIDCSNVIDERFAHQPAVDLNSSRRVLFNHASYCKMRYQEIRKVVSPEKCPHPLIYVGNTVGRTSNTPLFDLCSMPCRTPLLTSDQLHFSLLVFISSVLLIGFYSFLLWKITSNANFQWEEKWRSFFVGSSMFVAIAQSLVWLYWMTAKAFNGDTATCIISVDVQIRRDVTFGLFTECFWMGFSLHVPLLSAMGLLITAMLPIALFEKKKLFLLLGVVVGGCFLTGFFLLVAKAEADGISGVCNVSVAGTLRNANFIVTLVALLFYLVPYLVGKTNCPKDTFTIGLSLASVQGTIEEGKMLMEDKHIETVQTEGTGKAMRQPTTAVHILMIGLTSAAVLALWLVDETLVDYNRETESGAVQENIICAVQTSLLSNFHNLSTSVQRNNARCAQFPSAMFYQWMLWIKLLLVPALPFILTALLILTDDEWIYTYSPIICHTAKSEDKATAEEKAQKNTSESVPLYELAEPPEKAEKASTIDYEDISNATTSRTTKPRRTRNWVANGDQSKIKRNANSEPIKLPHIRRKRFHSANTSVSGSLPDATFNPISASQTQFDFSHSSINDHTAAGCSIGVLTDEVRKLYYELGKRDERIQLLLTGQLEAEKTKQPRKAVSTHSTKTGESDKFSSELSAASSEEESEPIGSNAPQGNNTNALQGAKCRPSAPLVTHIDSPFYNIVPAEEGPQPARRLQGYVEVLLDNGTTESYPVDIQVLPDVSGMPPQLSLNGLRPIAPANQHPHLGIEDNDSATSDDLYNVDDPVQSQSASEKFNKHSSDE